MSSVTVGPLEPGLPMWAMVAGALAGACLMVSSLVLIRAGRGGRRATPTRLTAGVSGLIIGYHMLAWSLPSGWLALRVPFERAWVVGVVAGVALSGSLLADRLEARDA